MKKYKQLSQAQRYTIECLLESGFNQKEISKSIGKSESTISRELKRNVNKRGKHANKYDSQRAQAKTAKRHKEKDKHKRLMGWQLKYIREKLRDQRWSPEYISERGKLEYGNFVSHETIYQYIWYCKHSNKKEIRKDKDLHKYLRHNNRRQKRKKHKQNKGCIPNRTSIEKRPKIVNERKRRGDLEVDLMMGSNHKPGLIVITDRKTIETKLIKITTKRAKVIAAKIIEKLKRESTKVYTLTFDNGLEFAEHQEVSKQLNVKTYFTRPYTSQDKGTVENRIGVIRRFFPKGTDMSKVHHNTIKSVERKLNNRPVRKFNYLTPLEKKKSITKIALIT
jgi:IS30 family transposase